MTDFISYFVLLRIGAFFFVSPLFENISISFFLKVILIFGLSLILTSFVTTEIPQEASLWVAVREIFIGLCLGFLSRLFFFSAQIAGNLIQSSLSDGLKQNHKIWSDFQVLFIVVLFFSLNGHYALISGLFQSFEIVPISHQWLNLTAFEPASFVQEVFTIGVNLSLPFLFCIFLMKVIGILAQKWSSYLRLLAGEPSLYFGTLLLAFLICLPFAADFVNSLIQMSLDKIINWLKVV